MDKKKGTFILDEFGNIVFYSGDLHELSDISFDADNILGSNLVNVFDYEIVKQLSKSTLSGDFQYKNENFIYKRKLFRVSNKLLVFIEIEAESDENVSFYSMLIHEIKNPLAAIRTLVQSLSVYALDSENHLDQEDYMETSNDYFDRITSEIDRLNRLLGSVKFITKHIKSYYVTFDVIQIANSTIKLFEETLKSKEINLITKFSDPSILYYGDPDQFQQIFNNLISNSIEAIKDSKNNIFFNIARGNDKNILINVEDEGSGIDKNEISNIFKAFYTKKIGGMGVGLSVVKMIIKSYKGKISIESKINKGTKVSINLPLLEK